MATDIAGSLSVLGGAPGIRAFASHVFPLRVPSLRSYLQELFLNLPQTHKQITMFDSRKPQNDPVGPVETCFLLI